MQHTKGIEKCNVSKKKVRHGEREVANDLRKKRPSGLRKGSPSHTKGRQRNFLESMCTIPFTRIQLDDVASVVAGGGLGLVGFPLML